METIINKTEYKFLKYRADFEPKFITLSNKFKIPKNELFGAMVIYFDKSNRDPRELNFDSSMERVIKILNKNERDYLKPIYSYLLDEAVSKEDTFQLLQSFLKSQNNLLINDIHAPSANDKKATEIEFKEGILPIEIKEKIVQIFMAFANEISKANEFERREIFLSYKSKLNEL